MMMTTIQAGTQVHVHEGNEGGGDEKFVRDGVKENAERGDLQTTAARPK